MSGMALGPALGAALLVLYYSSECWLRRGAARSWRRGHADRSTTLATTSANLAAIALPLALRAALPDASPPAAPATCAAATIATTGVALRFWAMRVLGERFSRTLVVGSGHVLETRGPYRLIRHPGYLAALLALPACGFLVAGSTWGALAALLPLAAAYAVRIPAEEAMLAAAFGDAWRAYSARTWRLLPRIL